MSDQEKKVFSQELNRDDLKAVAGGSDDRNCTGDSTRSIYGGKGFPNCANTVEDGSSCDHSDACVSTIVTYFGMHTCFISDCHKAWS